MTTHEPDDPALQWVGAAELERRTSGLTPRRLPAWCAPQFDLMTAMAVSAPSGVRLAFETDSDWIELTASPTTIVMGHTRRTPSIDLVINNEIVANSSEPGGVVVTVADGGEVDVDDLGPAVFRFDGLQPERKAVELWLPPMGEIQVSAVAVADNAHMWPSTDDRPRWIHYGSSISQCAEAHSPARIWPAVTAHASDLSLVNLGLAGSCHLDQFVARHIRDLDADIITMKVGINIVNQANMTRRTFTPALHGFLDTIRDGHPTTPIVVASPIFCPGVEKLPGPTERRPDGVFVHTGTSEDLDRGALSLKVVRELIASAVDQRTEAGDTNLRYLDGLQLFGADDVHDLPDDLHPNGNGYLRIGERFAAAVFAPGGLAPHFAS